MTKPTSNAQNSNNTPHHIKKGGLVLVCVSYNSTLVSYLFDYHLVNLLFFFLYILFTVSLPFIIAFTFVHVPTLTVNYITMVIVVCSRRVTFKTLNSFAIKEKYCGLSLLFLGRTNLFSVTIKAACVFQSILFKITNIQKKIKYLPEK